MLKTFHDTELSSLAFDRKSQCYTALAQRHNGTRGIYIIDSNTLDHTLVTVKHKDQTVETVLMHSKFIIYSSKETDVEKAYPEKYFVHFRILDQKKQLSENGLVGDLFVREGNVTTAMAVVELDTRPSVEDHCEKNVCEPDDSMLPDNFCIPANDYMYACKSNVSEPPVEVD